MLIKHFKSLRLLQTVVFLMFFKIYSQNNYSNEQLVKKTFKQVDYYLFDKQNPDTAIIYLEKTLKNKSFDYDLFESEVYYRKGIIELQKRKHLNAIVFFKKALTIFKKEKNLSKIGKCESNIGLNYELLDNRKEALKYYLNAEKKLNEFDLPSLFSNLASLYIGLGDNKTALNYAYKSYNLLKKQNNELRLIECSNILGYIYLIENKNLKAIDFYTVSLRLSKKKKLNFYIATAKVNLALAESNLNLKENKNIIRNYLEAKKIFLKEKYSKNEIATINFNLAEIYYKNKDFNNSEKYLMECYRFSISDNDIELKCNSELLLGKIYESKKDFSNAEIFYKKALSNSLKNKIDKITSETYLQLSKLYEKTNKNNIAFNYYKKHDYLENKIQEKEKELSIESLMIKFDVSQYKQNLKVKNQEIELLKIKSNQVKYQYSFFILLILGLIFFIYRQYKIININKMNLIYKEEINKLKEEALNKEVQFKNNQVTEFALQIQEQNQLLANLKNNLSSFKNSIKDTETSEKLKNLQFQINETIVLNNEKIEFNKEIKNTQDAFLFKLNELYPDLIEKEIQIATYIRLNFNTKQIANQLNIGEQSVNNYRASIRKKLNLSKEDNLKKFLKNL